MAPPLPHGENYDDHPVARQLYVRQWVRMFFVMATLIGAFAAAVLLEI